MSELQIGLLGLGALVVVGVLVFNKWQERAARRDGARHFGSGHEDVLLEPRRGDVAPAEYAPVPATESADADRRIEPTWAPEAQDAAVPAAEAAPAALEAAPGKAGPLHGAAPQLDDRIDFVAELVTEEPLLGSLLLMEMEKLDRTRTIEADAFYEEAGTWGALDRDAVYERMRIGIQVSDRSGPLRADELAAFQRGINDLAARLQMQVQWPGEQNPLTRAAELDAFCAGVDVTIGVNVIAAAPFADTKLRGLAEANGFTRDTDGVFRRRDDEGHVLLSLRQAAPTAVSLSLDVPRVAREAAALGLMTHCAKRFGAGLDGKLVDDNGKALDDAAIAAIQSSLGTVYGRMEAAGMAAGSPLARRLFV